MRAKAAASIAIAGLVLTACGTVSPLRGAVPGAVSSRARVESPPPPLASGERLPSPSPAPAGLTSCRLPIASISEAEGWFMDYPGGATHADPASVVALPGGTPGQLGANPGLTYDRALSTWVPVPYSWLAPSGRVYAYEDFSSGRIVAVTVPDGAPTVVAATGNWILIGTADDGVYVFGPTAPGVWFIPFGGGAMRQVVDHGSWEVFNANALWGFTGGSNGRLLRHDLSTGAETTYATLGGWNDILGFDQSGHPLLSTTNDVPSDNAKQHYGFRIAFSNGSTRTLWSGAGMRAGGHAVGDAHGVWFEIGGGLIGAAGHGLYLWTPQHGARLISKTEANIAGSCG